MEEARKLAFAVAMCLLVGHHNRRETAEDLAQEAMLRIVRNKKPVRRSWRALVRTTISRLVWNHQRDEGTQGDHLHFDAKAAAGARDEWPGPLDRLIEEETEAELATFLEELDERFGVGTRAIVEFRIQGIPWDEVADLVGLPLRTCSRREAKALEWLSQRRSLQVAEGEAS